CLSHIESLALTVGNEALHSRNMLAALNNMLFDMAQQKHSFGSEGHWRAPRSAGGSTIVSQPAAPAGLHAGDQTQSTTGRFVPTLLCRQFQLVILRPAAPSS